MERHRSKTDKNDKLEKRRKLRSEASTCFQGLQIILFGNSSAPASAEYTEVAAAAAAKYFLE